MWQHGSERKSCLNESFRRFLKKMLDLKIVCGTAAVAPIPGSDCAQPRQDRAFLWGWLGETASLGLGKCLKWKGTIKISPFQKPVNLGLIALERRVPLELAAKGRGLEPAAEAPRHNDNMFWKVLDQVFCFFIILWLSVCLCWKRSFASSTTLVYL